MQFRLIPQATTDNGATELKSGAHSCFSMLRCLIGGVEVERIEHYGRTHELFRYILQSPEWLVNQRIEDGPRAIALGQKAALSLQPMLGLLSCNKGVVLEFTLAQAEDALADPVKSPNRAYTIEGAELRYSTVRLDSALEAGFASLLMQNRSLSLNFKTMISQQATVPAGSTEFSASIVRALSRVAAVFVSFYGRQNNDLTKHPLNFANPSANNGTGQEPTMQATLQIGGKQWPEHQPISSMAEAFALLRQALNIYSSSEHAVSITRAEYISNR